MIYVPNSVVKQWLCYIAVYLALSVVTNVKVVPTGRDNDQFEIMIACWLFGDHQMLSKFDLCLSGVKP